MKIGIPLVLVAGGIYGYLLYNQPHADIQSEKAAYQLEAEALAEAFSQDEDMANQKFLGEVVEVTGTVVELVDEGAGFGVILGGSGGIGVYGAFNTKTALTEGQQVTIRGRCSGYLMEVVLNDCVLVSKLE